MKIIIRFGTLVVVASFLQVTMGAQGSLPQLETVIDCLDGIQRDVSGASDVTAVPDPSTERMWHAQGRRRQAFQFDLRLLRFEEKHDTNSPLLAEEIDEANLRLLTLSGLEKRGDQDPSNDIYPVILLEDIQFPDAPAFLNSLTLDGPTLAPWFPGDPAPEEEPVCGIRVYPLEKRLLVVRDFSLLVIDYNNDALVIEGSIVLPDQPPLAATCLGEPDRSFRMMKGAEIAQIGSHRVAFLRTVMDHGDPTKPFARGILVCNLDNWAMPSFYTDEDQMYDPVPCPTPSPPFESFDYSVNSIDVVQEGPDTYLYLAGSRFLDLVRLKVTNIDDPTKGFEDEVSQDLGVNEHLLWIVADPLPSDNLFVIGERHAYAAKRDLVTPPEKTLSSFGRGPAQDALFFLELDEMGLPAKKISTVLGGAPDQRWKIPDVTNVFPGAPIVDEAYYAQDGADDAVAIF